jgi:hypothetical protein
METTVAVSDASGVIIRVESFGTGAEEAFFLGVAQPEIKIPAINRSANTVSLMGTS